MLFYVLLGCLSKISLRRDCLPLSKRVRPVKRSHRGRQKKYKALFPYSNSVDGQHALVVFKNYFYINHSCKPLIKTSIIELLVDTPHKIIRTSTFKPAVNHHLHIYTARARETRHVHLCPP